MKPAINNVSVRQRSGGPLPIPDLPDNRYNRPPRADLTGVERTSILVQDARIELSRTRVIL